MTLPGKKYSVTKTTVFGHGKMPAEVGIRNPQDDPDHKHPVGSDGDWSASTHHFEDSAGVVLGRRLDDRAALSDGGRRRRW